MNDKEIVVVLVSKTPVQGEPVLITKVNAYGKLSVGWTIVEGPRDIVKELGGMP